MKQNKEILKDLGVKIGTEKEVFWTQVKNAADNAIKEAKQNTMLQTAVSEMAQKMLEKEKALNSSKE